MYKVVIGISGKAQHGKDTAADYLISRFGGTKLSLASLLKEQATSLGWDGEKDNGGRTFLQTLSAPIKEYGNWLAEKYPEKYGDFGNNNYYAASLYHKILNDTEHKYFYIPDLRFKSELEFFESKNDEYFKFFSMRIIRPDFDNGLTKEQKQHISEIDLDDIDMDIMMPNDSTLDLYYQKLERTLRWLDA